MGSDDQRDGDTTVTESVDDGWALAEGLSEPTESIPDDTDGEDTPDSEDAPQSGQGTALSSNALADTRAALARARAALDESRAGTQGSAVDEADEDDEEGEDDEEEATATEDYDDGAVAAFRAKSEALQHRLSAAAREAQLDRRKSYILGLAGGLFVGIGIGWFASQATTSPESAANTSTSNSTAAATAPAVIVPPPATEIEPSPEPTEVAAIDPAPLPDAMTATEDPPVATVDNVREEPPADAAVPTPDTAAPADGTATEVAPVDAPPSSAAPVAGKAITSPREGVISKVFAKPGQRVWKGERLFEVSRQASAAEVATQQEAKIAELEAVPERSEVQEAELTEARRKLDLFKTGFRGDRKSVAYAPEGGYFDHQLETGSVVKLGDVMGQLRELEK